MKPGSCQVGSETEHPCLHLAVVEIRGTRFCEPCARKQEAYFAIGELTRGKQSPRGRTLAEALNGLRRERAGDAPPHPGARPKSPDRGAIRSGSA